MGFNTQYLNLPATFTAAWHSLKICLEHAHGSISPFYSMQSSFWVLSSIIPIWCVWGQAYLRQTCSCWMAKWSCEKIHPFWCHGQWTVLSRYVPTTWQEALSGPNSLEDQKCFLLKFYGLLPFWCLLIISTRWMEGESCYNLNVTVEEGFVKWAGALSQAPSENVSAVHLTPELLIWVASDCSEFCITVFFLL